jgi:hypothetical protein
VTNIFKKKCEKTTFFSLSSVCFMYIEVERDVSLVGLIKGKLENRLQNPHLNDKMQVARNGKPMESFNYQRTIEIFNTGFRRPAPPQQ